MTDGHPVKKTKQKGRWLVWKNLTPHPPHAPPHRQKWMNSFWTRKEESCHCHLVHAVSDAAGWTWGWGINLHPRTGLDILFPDGSSPAVDSAPKRPGILARPIHHRSLILGAGGPQQGAPARMFLPLWLKQLNSPLENTSSPTTFFWG